MRNDLLPTSVEIGGAPYEIESDFWAVRDICIALSDPDLDDRGKARVALEIFYPEFEQIPPECYQEALEKCLWFINGGEEEFPRPKQPRLYDFEQDTQLIIAAINSNSPCDVRSLEHYHHWTFLSDFMEKVKDSTFAQVVAIRDKQARGKKLEKHEQEWLRHNRQLVDFKRKYTQEDDEIFNVWFGA